MNQRPSIWEALILTTGCVQLLKSGQEHTFSGPMKQQAGNGQKSALYTRLKKRETFKIVKGGPLEPSETPVCCKVRK